MANYTTNNNNNYHLNYINLRRNFRNLADDNGLTHLHKAALRGRMQDVELLLSVGANVNKADKDGRTPLHMASSHGHPGVVRLLLAKGADLSKRDRDGKTALDLAYGTVKKLLREAGGEGPNGQTRWRNMNNEERRGVKPILLKRAIVKGLKNGRNATFTEPILYADYYYRDLKPVNRKNKHITSFGLVIDDKNNVKYILDLEGARRAMRNVRERANRLEKRVEQPLPGIIFSHNWSLVNFNRVEYCTALGEALEELNIGPLHGPRSPPLRLLSTGNLVARMNRMNLASLKLLATKLKIRVTNIVNGKRVPKSEEKLRTQILNVLARKKAWHNARKKSN